MPAGQRSSSVNAAAQADHVDLTVMQTSKPLLCDCLQGCCSTVQQACANYENDKQEGSTACLPREAGAMQLQCFCIAMPSAYQWVDGQQREGKAQQQGEDDDDNVEAAAASGSSRVEPVEHDADEGEGAHIAANCETQEAIQEPAGSGAAICTCKYAIQALPAMAALGPDVHAFQGSRRLHAGGCCGLAGHQHHGQSNSTALAIGHALTCLPLSRATSLAVSVIQARSSINAGLAASVQQRLGVACQVTCCMSGWSCVSTLFVTGCTTCVSHARLVADCSPVVILVNPGVIPALRHVYQDDHLDNHEHP